MFILQNNHAASVITSSQFGAIKFFLLGAPSKGLGRRGGREGGAWPLPLLDIHTSLFSGVSHPSRWLENWPWIPDPTVLSDGDTDSPGPLYRLSGCGGRVWAWGGLELSSVTWFGHGAVWLPLSSQGDPQFCPCAPRPPLSLREETNSAQPHPAQPHPAIHPGRQGAENPSSAEGIPHLSSEGATRFAPFSKERWSSPRRWHTYTRTHEAFPASGSCTNPPSSPATRDDALRSQQPLRQDGGAAPQEEAACGRRGALRAQPRASQRWVPRG